MKFIYNPPAVSSTKPHISKTPKGYWRLTWNHGLCVHDFSEFGRLIHFFRTGCI